jgi:hypothetical protein
LKFFFHILLLCSILTSYRAQEPQTIKVKKEQNLVKVFFDNSDLRLTPIDRFGNPRDNKIKSFKLWIKSKEVKCYTSFDNALTSEMITELNKQKKAVKIFFTDINVEDDSSHLIQLPDVIETWFPNCKNCGETQRMK